MTGRTAAMLAAVAMMGCITTRTEFRKDDIDGLRVGVTTQADARRVFGQPSHVRLGDGVTELVWTCGEMVMYTANSGKHAYFFSEYSGGQWPSLSLMFGPDDRLVRSPAIARPGSTVPVSP